MQQEWINALMGGIIIGLAVTLMLILNGRVTGISGILSGLLAPVKGDIAWRACFLFGLILGGLVLKFIYPQSFAGTLPADLGVTAIAGVLVGFGTVLGSGCTSGHGVCGISRMSMRSIVATLIFISVGVMAVVLFKKIGVLQ